MKCTIAYHYLRAGKIEVEASSLEEAKELAYEASADNEGNEFFVDGSFEINEEMTDEYNAQQLKMNTTSLLNQIVQREVPAQFVMESEDSHEFYLFKKFLSRYFNLVYDVKEDADIVNRMYRATFTLIR